MRIRSLRVENFRGIRLLDLAGLQDAIVIAGPNGCGKSSLFDAIRLLKSAYGQYHQNEYQSWLNEFQINIQNVRRDASRVLHDPSKPLSISAEFELTQEEQAYLKENARELYEQMNWATFRGAHSSDGGPLEVNPTMRRVQGANIARQTARLMEELEKVIDREYHPAALTMDPGTDPVVISSPVVELIFSLYQPEHLGVVDFHGPNRNYVREQVGQVSLQINQNIERGGQHALYNTQNKYNNVKAEMAQAFVRQVLAEKAGVQIPDNKELSATLEELFKAFFPGKTFLGAIPTQDGQLRFPVRLENGREHDIDELSSGEKEVLLGYLRLRSSAPKNSIILLDEPELHLNPLLIRALPRFYQQHLGKALGNQLWLITHSDALLRAAVEESAYDVFHMQPSYTTEPGSNQVVPISATAEIERAIIDLVGDLATYSPRFKVVLLEGESSEVDANLIRELFPNFAERVNLISVGTKRRVGALHELLEKAAEQGRLDARFYSIVDSDGESQFVRSERQFAWPVYHIENFLLEPKFIQQVIASLNLGEALPSEDEILRILRDCAEATVDDLVRIRLQDKVNRELVGCISCNPDRREAIADALRTSIEASVERLHSISGDTLSLDKLRIEEEQTRNSLVAALEDDRWMSEFRGRDILKRFIGSTNLAGGVPYPRFRNMIIHRMREAEFEPEGMADVINAILKHGQQSSREDSPVERGTEAAAARSS